MVRPNKEKPSEAQSAPSAGQRAVGLYSPTRLETLCGCGMLLAMDLALNQFKLIISPTLQVSFAFLAVALCGWAYGPLWTAVMCGLADVLEYLLLPDGPFNPLWTVLAFVPGVLYGLFLHKRPVTLARTALARAVTVAVVNLGLNPLCMSWLYGSGYWYFLSERLVKNLALLVPEIALLYALLRAVERVLGTKHKKKH